MLEIGRFQTNVTHFFMVIFHLFAIVLSPFLYNLLDALMHQLPLHFFQLMVFEWGSIFSFQKSILGDFS